MKRIILILLVIAPVWIFGQNGKIIDRFPLKDLTSSPLYIVDGVDMKSGFNIDSLNCEDIDNIEISKDPYSTAIYGTRGMKGVYIITTKAGKYKEASRNIQIDKKMLTLEVKLSQDANEPVTPLFLTEALQGCLCKPAPINENTEQFRIRDKSPYPDTQSPLIIIDGIIMDISFNINQIPVNDIHSFKVYRDEEAVALFGTQGRNGVISISTIPPTEYETIVFAPGYETFLATQKSKDFYSESYLKTKNVQMVSEWNYRCNTPSVYNPKIYEATIDYNAQTDYGIDVEYELYMFFRFMEKENRMSLINDIARL